VIPDPSVTVTGDPDVPPLIVTGQVYVDTVEELIVTDELIVDISIPNVYIIIYDIIFGATLMIIHRSYIFQWSKPLLVKMRKKLNMYDSIVFF